MEDGSGLMVKNMESEDVDHNIQDDRDGKFCDSRSLASLKESKQKKKGLKSGESAQLRKCRPKSFTDSNTITMQEGPKIHMGPETYSGSDIIYDLANSCEFLYERMDCCPRPGTETRTVNGMSIPKFVH